MSSASTALSLEDYELLDFIIQTVCFMNSLSDWNSSNNPVHPRKSHNDMERLRQWEVTKNVGSEEEGKKLLSTLVLSLSLFPMSVNGTSFLAVDENIIAGSLFKAKHIFKVLYELVF